MQQILRILHNFLALLLRLLTRLPMCLSLGVWLHVSMVTYLAARSVIPFWQEAKKWSSGTGIPVPVGNSDYSWRKFANIGADRNSWEEFLQEFWKGTLERNSWKEFLKGIPAGIPEIPERKPFGLHSLSCVILLYHSVMWESSLPPSKTKCKVFVSLPRQTTHGLCSFVVELDQIKKHPTMY